MGYQVVEFQLGWRRDLAVVRNGLELFECHRVACDLSFRSSNAR